MDKKLNVLIISSSIIIVFVVLNYFVTLKSVGVLSSSQSEAFGSRGKRTIEVLAPLSQLNIQEDIIYASTVVDDKKVADEVCKQRELAGQDGCTGKGRKEAGTPGAGGQTACALAYKLRSEFLSGKPVCCEKKEVFNDDASGNHLPPTTVVVSKACPN